MNVINNHVCNIIEYPSKGQDIINKSEEPVFFPVVDRFSSNFYENVAQKMLEREVESPFTIRIGGVDYVLDRYLYCGPVIRLNKSYCYDKRKNGSILTKSMLTA